MGSIYGIHSGRNNTAKFIARSYMYNSQKTNKNYIANNTESDEMLRFIATIIVLIPFVLLYLITY